LISDNISAQEKTYNVLKVHVVQWKENGYVDRSFWWLLLFRYKENASVLGVYILVGRL
jgi:hypothetical protein